MNENQKIDFLMDLTKTKNITLANALFFDPSYIGRIRSGKRGIPTHRNFIEPVAEFFSQKINDIYQRNILSEILNHGVLIPDDRDAIKRLLILWLTDNSTAPAGRSEFPPLPTSQEFTTIATDIDYGSEGKRRLILSFLHNMTSIKKPINFLFFSDELSSWFYEDEDFVAAWSDYMMGLLSSGSHLKVIQSPRKTYNEMMTSINNWLPLYRTGAIEPYYYPLLRDGIYRRTLLIAEGIASFMSSSIMDDMSAMPQFLFYNSNVSAALTKEFYNYYSLCSPIIEVYQNREIPDPKLKRKIENFNNSNDTLYTLRRKMTNSDIVLDIQLKQSVGAFIRFPDGTPTVLYTSEPNMIISLVDFIKVFG